MSRISCKDAVARPSRKDNGADCRAGTASLAATTALEQGWTVEEAQHEVDVFLKSLATLGRLEKRGFVSGRWEEDAIARMIIPGRWATVR